MWSISPTRQIIFLLDAIGGPVGLKSVNGFQEAEGVGRSLIELLDMFVGEKDEVALVSRIWFYYFGSWCLAPVSYSAL